MTVDTSANFICYRDVPILNIETILRHTSMSHSIKNNATQKNALDKNCSSSAWGVPGSAKIKRIVTRSIRPASLLKISKNQLPGLSINGTLVVKKLFQEAKKKVLKHNSFKPIMHNVTKMVRHTSGHWRKCKILIACLTILGRYH